jgi:hypothetical protein
MLISGGGLTFDYIACGENAATQTLFATPKTVAALTTSASSSSQSTPAASSLSSQTSSTTPTSTPPASSSINQSGSSSSQSTSPSPSTSPSTSPPNPSEQKSTPIGPIVGGVIGGLTLICLTVLGVFLIRRRRGATPSSQKPLSGDPSDDAGLVVHGSRNMQKGYHWDSSHGPVEMYSSHHVNTEPVELHSQTADVR